MCLLNCAYCPPGASHLCRKCGVINRHFTRNCPSHACIFNCGIGNCRLGKPHRCRKCGILNDHRTNDCMAKVSTLTATCVAFGTTYVLVCRRGVPDVDYGKIYSAGGSIDSSETAPGAAVRELHEESGVVVDVSSLKQIFPYSNSKVMHYIVNIDPSIIITGPSLQHRWEVLTSETQICGVPVIPGTGWTWVQLDDLRRAGEDSEFSKNVLPFIG